MGQMAQLPLDDTPDRKINCTDSFILRPGQEKFWEYANLSPFLKTMIQRQAMRSFWCFPIQKVDDVEKDFYFVKRKHMGTWINTGLYKSVWKAIAKSGEYAGYDLTIKVDADAVSL